VNIKVVSDVHVTFSNGGSAT